MARLVAKGYNSKLGFDYKETFLLVTMLKSIRVLLFSVTDLDYKIWKMNVKTMFLNDYPDEIIYMIQLGGFIEKGQVHLLCKFHKSIYGLKKTFHSIR